MPQIYLASLSVSSTLTQLRPERIGIDADHDSNIEFCRQVALTIFYKAPVTSGALMPSSRAMMWSAL